MNIFPIQIILDIPVIRCMLLTHVPCTAPLLCVHQGLPSILTDTLASIISKCIVYVYLWVKLIQTLQKETSSQDFFLKEKSLAFVKNVFVPFPYGRTALPITKRILEN